jgi:hypothetical protein
MGGAGGSDDRSVGGGAEVRDCFRCARGHRDLDQPATVKV